MKKLFAFIFFLIAATPQSFGQVPTHIEKSFYTDYKLIDTSNIYGLFYNNDSIEEPHYIGWRQVEPTEDNPSQINFVNITLSLQQSISSNCDP